MSERIGKLKETLTELRLELSKVDKIDDETRKMLEAVMEQIHDATHREDENHLDHPSLKESLSKVTEDFEQSHPDLTRVVGNMVDILGNSGF